MGAFNVPYFTQLSMKLAPSGFHEVDLCLQLLRVTRQTGVVKNHWKLKTWIAASKAL
jgi:hypothetical protein